ncbi:MAG: WD40 repeat domain-containing protein, partial [Acidimicrobiia bacterium]
ARANPTWGSGRNEDGTKAAKVSTVLEAGDVLYVGGEFTEMVPPGTNVRNKYATAEPRSYLAALEVATGKLMPWAPVLDGPVHALALSPDGRRLYIGGSFDVVNGKPAKHVAAFDLTTGQLDPAFRPPVLNSGVRALALHGDRLYAGGNFTSVGVPDGTEVPRPQLTALDASDGSLVDWTPPDADDGCYKGQTGEHTSGCDGIVYDVVVSRDGKLVHAAGDFLNFGSEESGLVTIDAATGEATEWQGDVDDRPVFGLSISPADGHTLYTAAGGAGGRVFTFDPGADDDGEPLWEGRTDGDATDVVATAELVFLVGHFDFIILDEDSDCYQYCPDDGNPNRRHLAAFDPANGNLDGWNATANTAQGPYFATLGARHLYIAGDFTEINGGPQPGLAQFPAEG